MTCLSGPEFRSQMNLYWSGTFNEQGEGECPPPNEEVEASRCQGLQEFREHITAVMNTQ